MEYCLVKRGHKLAQILVEHFRHNLSYFEKAAVLQFGFSRNKKPQSMMVGVQRGIWFLGAAVC